MLLNKLNLFMKCNFENEMCILMNDRAEDELYTESIMWTYGIFLLEKHAKNLEVIFFETNAMVNIIIIFTINSKIKLEMRNKLYPLYS